MVPVSRKFKAKTAVDLVYSTGYLGQSKYLSVSSYGGIGEADLWDSFYRALFHDQSHPKGPTPDEYVNI